MELFWTTNIHQFYLKHAGRSGGGLNRRRWDHLFHLGQIQTLLLSSLALHQAAWICASDFAGSVPSILFEYHLRSITPNVKRNKGPLLHIAQDPPPVLPWIKCRMVILPVPAQERIWLPIFSAFFSKALGFPRNEKSGRKKYNCKEVFADRKTS